MHQPSNNTFCGCGTISGDNCRIKLTANESTSGTNCLVLGDGVTFNLNGYDLNCSVADCGIAIQNGASSGGADKVVIKNGKISGCFDVGIFVNGGTDSSVQDLEINLGASCTNGSNFLGGLKTQGIVGLRGTIARTRIHNTNIGVQLLAGEDIVDSVLKGNIHGAIASNSSGIDNVLFQDNSAAHIWEYKGNYDPDISGSSFTGTGCNCSTTPSGSSTAETCQSGGLRDCATFQAPPSKVCDPPDEGTGTGCSIEE